MESLNEAAADSTCQSVGGSESHSQASKKSSGDHTMDVMIELIGKMHDETNARMQSL